MQDCIRVQIRKEDAWDTNCHNNKVPCQCIMTNKTELEQQSKEKEAIAFLESLGYQFLPEEKSFTRKEKQATERYSLKFLQERLYYEDMLTQKQLDHSMIDTFFHYLYNAVNSTKSTIRVNGENKPKEVVVSVLLKLEYFDFLYAIEKYKENTTKVRNHGAYIITLLYNAKAQNEADISNQVQHDLYS